MLKPILHVNVIKRDYDKDGRTRLTLDTYARRAKLPKFKIYWLNQNEPVNLKGLIAVAVPNDR